MRLYRPSSLLMRKDSNFLLDKGRAQVEREMMNVVVARREEEIRQEKGTKEIGKSH